MKFKKRINPFNEIYRSKEYTRKAVNLIHEFPMIIDIELTNHCNLKCKMCSRQIMTRKTGYMDKRLFKKIIDECAKYRTAIRLIRWGEPFLHPHILELCEYVKSKGLILHITNNGMVISESQMKGLIDIGVDSIIFSMQGTTEDEYEKMRQGAIYSLFYTNIMKLLELRGDKNKPYIHLSTTITDETEEEIQEFKNAWKDVVDSVGVGRTNMARLTNEIPVDGKYINCKEPWQKMSIDWDGKVTACCGDYDNLLTIGDVNKESLFEIWNNSNILLAIRILLAYGKNRYLTLCSKCYPAYGDFN